jgi:hypothetical protein
MMLKVKTIYLLNLIKDRIKIRRLLLLDMHQKGIKITRLTYRKYNPYPVSSEVLFKVIYKSQYNRPISKASINKLKTYFNE